MSELKVDQQATDFLPAGFDPIQSMRILTDYLITLESTYNEFQKKVSNHQRQSEASIRSLTKQRDDLEQEKERLTRDLLHLTSQVEELESALLTANQKVISFEKQIKKLHRDNEQMEGLLSQKENDNNFLQAEVDRLSKDFENVNSNLLGMTSRMDDLERKLANSRTHTTVQEKEIRHLSSSLSESQGKINILENKIAEDQTRHSEEIKKLQERLNSDSKHEANLLKKRVRTAVGPELVDLERLSNEKLSNELASNLKALIGRLISKLEQVGFELN
jgi:chromosome segregation ATPase